MQTSSGHFNIVPAHGRRCCPIGSRVIPANVTFTKLSTVVPVSLRPYTHVPDTVFCDHISTHASCVNIRDYSKGGDVCNPHEFPWHAASRFAKTLSEKAKSTREHVGLLKLVSGPLEDFILGRQGKKRDETMELSNIGRFPADESTPASDPRWTIEDTYIVQSDAICGSAFKIMIIGSPAGSIGITINWTVGVVDEVLAESFVTRFTKLIDAFCASRGERS
ncbi:hypothetical protein EUX98_g4072 [Antrodiella citrinella]|uniref:O-acyltransferase WSD1 C-terminal domain-containing protein n=1 Tax=Antrodiella citrinella TaxID=2447956 RepID=A0A4V3XIQ4_9APHY|nr:hypothetical protein EUX98_g4072 [Antrodiella citrinella]